MENNKFPQKAIRTIQSWKGFEDFDGHNPDFLGKDPEIFEDHQHTVLMEAVARQDVGIVKNLIEAGTNVNAINKGTQQSPLLCLPEKSEKGVEISNELINAGADINYIQKDEEVIGDQWFNTPLIDACMHGKYELVRTLLKAGADVNLSWKNGLTAICMVDCESKHYINILKALISAGANVNDCGSAALQGAIRESKPEAIKILIDSGAKLDMQSTDKFYEGRTPFMSFLKGEAVDLGVEEEQELFLLFCKNIGNINIQDKGGESLIFYALDTSIGGDDFDLFVLDKVLFSKSIHINLANNKGNTALNAHLLSLEEQGYSTDELYDDEKYKIESLLIAGSDIEIRNDNGDSPKIIAERISNKELQSLLENHKAFINTENRMGQTPLFIACLQSQTEKVMWLIDKGAYVNAKNKCNRIPRGMDLYGTFVQTYEEAIKPKFYTALMAAQNIETVRALIKAGADMNEQNSDGNTALMLYTKDNWLEGVEELITAGADTNITNKWYETALIIAKKNSKSKAMHYKEPEKLTHLLKEHTTRNFAPSVLSPMFCIFRSE